MATGAALLARVASGEPVAAREWVDFTCAALELLGVEHVDAREGAAS